MALYEVVKQAKVTIDGKVVMLRNVGAVVDLNPEQLSAFSDAVRPVGSPDEPVAQPDSADQTGEQANTDSTDQSGEQASTDQTPNPTPDPTSDSTPESRRRRARGEGSDAG